MDIKERPIIFSSCMVRAILDGRKTQTRIPIEIQIDWIDMCNNFDFIGVFEEDSLAYAKFKMDELTGLIKCPFGKVGDVLWVRETWAFATTEEFEYSADWVGIKYKSDNEILPNIRTADEVIFKDNIAYKGWRSSVHMPRWASRITLEITDIRVERVQNISGKDACDEGIEEDLVYPRKAFEILWNSIYGEDAWERNDWVFVIEFRRV